MSLSQAAVNMTLDMFHETYVERTLELFVEEAYKRAGQASKTGLAFEHRKSVRCMALAEWSNMSDAQKIIKIQQAQGLASNKTVPNGFIWNWRHAVIAPRESKEGSHAESLYVAPAPKGNCRFILRTNGMTRVIYVSDS